MRIPTQIYGFLEVEGGQEDLQAMEKLHKEYAEQPLPFRKGTFVELETFTGERIRYNDETHEYEDMSGNKLISASQFAESKEKPFDKEAMLPRMEKKLGVDASVIDEMWNGGGAISRTFGTAIHATMEQWFKYKEYGTEYHIAKHPFLRNLVETFPKREANILPELLVSSVVDRMVGRMDGLEVTGEKVGNIIDFKSDANVKKNLERHSLQLSYYATILEKFGWKIEHLYIENFTDKWDEYELIKQTIKL